MAHPARFALLITQAVDNDEDEEEDGSSGGSNQSLYFGPRNQVWVKGQPTLSLPSCGPMASSAQGNAFSTKHKVPYEIALAQWC